MTEKRVMGLVLVSIFLLGGGSASSSESLPEEFMVIIEESFARGGQMMILEMEPERLYRIGSTLIDAPLEKVWEVLTDFENWSEFVPMMTKSKIAQRKENRVTLDITLTTRLLMIPFHYSYTMVYELEKPKVFILCPEKLEKTGFYKLLSMGEKTLLIVSEQAPCLEEMGGLIALIARVVPGAELALHLSPQFVFLEAMRGRAEGN